MFKDWVNERLGSWKTGASCNYQLQHYPMTKWLRLLENRGAYEERGIKRHCVLRTLDWFRFSVAVGAGIGTCEVDFGF